MRRGVVRRERAVRVLAGVGLMGIEIEIIVVVIVVAAVVMRKVARRVVMRMLR
jgi:hypothetical protein